jgi:glucose/arabinose dehydrogenase
MPQRRHSGPLLAAAVLLVLGGLTSCGSPPASPSTIPSSARVPSATPSPVSTASAAPSTSAWPSAFSGLGQVTNIVAPDDGSGLLFVTGQSGVIRVIRAGRLETAPALDIRPLVDSRGGEQGLLGLAFPPRFAAKRYAYVYFTDTGGDATFWRVRMRTDGTDHFDPASLQLILRVPEPYANHQGGQLAFGPDGYLYIGLGDGGSERDPGDRGQDLSILLAKILRIDVESTPGSPGYRVPADNPFAASPAGRRTETWQYGLRNPWRFSFDRATGDLWIGDVGQDRWEEIDRVAGDRPGGLDFGWSLYEGNHPFKATSKRPGFAWPVAEYSHAEGSAVIGGYVYRGAQHPAESGEYVFGDLTGKIWTLRRLGSVWVRRLVLTTGYQISTFGVDGSGELWVADRGTGSIHRLGDLSR